MKTERIGNTIDLILLILFSVSSVFLCIQINLGNHLTVFAQIIFILLLIGILLIYFTTILKFKRFTYLIKFTLICFSGLILYCAFQLNQMNQVTEEYNEVYYRMNLVTNHTNIQSSTDLDESNIGILVSDRNHIQGFNDLDVAFKMKDCEIREYHNMTNLIHALDEDEIQGAILSDHNLSILNERFKNVEMKILSENGINVQVSHKMKDYDVHSPFSVLVSINDSNVPLNYVSASHQCFILFVDPTDKKITTIEIPNNLYIPNVAYDSYPDALYNVSYNGIDNLLYSLESVFGFEFDCFVKTNSKTIFNAVDIMQGITMPTEICVNDVCEVINENYDINAVKDYYHHTKDLQSILEGIFNKRNQLMGTKLINFINNYNENTFTNFSSTQLDNFITLINKDEQWTFEKVLIDDMTYSKEPCISYGVHDKHSVTIIHENTIDQIYSYYVHSKHIEQMNQFEFDLNLMDEGRFIPQVNPKLITSKNMYWKIDEYFAFLPQSVINPIEVEKWQGTIDFDEPNFDPDAPINPIE